MQHIGGLLQGWNFTVQIGALRLKENTFLFMKKLCLFVDIILWLSIDIYYINTFQTVT